MNTIKKICSIAIVYNLLLACGGSDTPKINSLENKKNIVLELKKEIAKLEKEIAEADTTNKLEQEANNVNTKKVSIITLLPQDFKHYIDLQGLVVNESDIMVMPLSGPGLVKAIFLKEGTSVKKGDVIIKLDDTIIANQINIVQSQLDYAKTIFQKQQKLWDEKIGSEVQVLGSKNAVDNLEKQLNGLKTALNYTNVAAPIDGIIDELNVKVGEIFTGLSMKGEAQVRVINSKGLKIKMDIPENYMSKVRVNSQVRIEFLENEQVYTESINAVSKHINPSTRCFVAEAKLNNNNSLRANQIAIVKILDFAANNAIVIPVNTMQIDEKGKFVFVLENKNGKKIVAKKNIIVKEIYAENALITSGLNAKEIIITEGYQNIVEGQELSNVE